MICIEHLLLIEMAVMLLAIDLKDSSIVLGSHCTAHVSRSQIRVLQHPWVPLTY